MSKFVYRNRLGMKGSIHFTGKMWLIFLSVAFISGIAIAWLYQYMAG